METVVVAPGIWRIRVGEPEADTPLTLPAWGSADTALAAMPAPTECPVTPSAVRFDAHKRGALVRLPLAADEQVYGLGLQLMGFNHRNRRQTLRVNSDPTADLGDSHAPVPFYVSTAGYGVLIDTARYATFFFGATKLRDRSSESEQTASGSLAAVGNVHVYTSGGSEIVEIEVPYASGVNIYVFAGPTLSDAVRRYNLFAGGGPLVPRWGLGVWYRPNTKATQEEILSLAGDLRESKMPCDVIGLESGWQTHSYSCSFLWSDKFPDPRDMIRELASENFRLNLWTHAFINRASPIYNRLAPYAGDHEVWDGLIPDFTLSEARRIFAELHAREHVDIGVSGYKLDECDSSDFLNKFWSFPESTQFPSGLDGEQYHSVFGIKYQETIDSIFRARNQRAYHLVRNSHLLAAPYPFVLYSDLYDHKQFIRGTVNCGFSGLLWTPELRHAESEEDLVRRIQSLVFSPMALVNAWYIKDPPWKQWRTNENNAGRFLDNWEQVEARCREAFEWRMRFLPYLYSSFVRYHTDGTPPFRALVMDYPDDPAVHDLDDQYLVGDRVLVAPVVAGEAERSVYLPHGLWRDFWSGIRFEGGRSIAVQARLDQIPLFVKENSVLPLAEVTVHTNDPNSFRLTVRVYGDGDLPMELWEDDGATFDFDRGARNQVILTWRDSGGRLDRIGSGDYPRYEVTAWEPIR